MYTWITFVLDCPPDRGKIDLIIKKSSKKKHEPRITFLLYDWKKNLVAQIVALNAGHIVTHWVNIVSTNVISCNECNVMIMTDLKQTKQSFGRMKWQRLHTTWGCCCDSQWFKTKKWYHQNGSLCITQRIRWGWVRYSLGWVKYIRRRLRTRSLVYQFHILEDNMWIITWRDDCYQGVRLNERVCCLVRLTDTNGQSHYIDEKFKPKYLKIEWYLIQKNWFLETCSRDWNWNLKLLKHEVVV